MYGQGAGLQIVSQPSYQNPYSAPRISEKHLISRPPASPRIYQAGITSTPHLGLSSSGVSQGYSNSTAVTSHTVQGTFAKGEMSPQSLNQPIHTLYGPRPDQNRSHSRSNSVEVPNIQRFNSPMLMQATPRQDPGRSPISIPPQYPPQPLIQTMHAPRNTYNTPTSQFQQNPMARVPQPQPQYGVQFPNNGESSLLSNGRVIASDAGQHSFGPSQNHMSQLSQTQFRPQMPMNRQLPPQQPGGMGPELQQRVQELKRYSDRLDTQIAQLQNNRFGGLNPSQVDQQSLSKILQQQRDNELQKKLIETRLEALQTENRRNKQHLEDLYSTISGLDGCEELQRENDNLRQRYKRTQAELQGKVGTRIAEIERKMRSHLENEANFLGFRYNTDDQALKSDVKGYIALLTETNRNMQAGRDPRKS